MRFAIGAQAGYFTAPAGGRSEWQKTAINSFHNRRCLIPPGLLPWSFPLTDLFREVEEDLRRERFKKLWDDYGLYLVGVAVGVVLITAGVIGWRAYEKSRNEAASAAFTEMVKSTTGSEMSDADIAKTYGDFAANTSGGYAALARLHEAASLLAANDKEGAAKAYDALIADSSAPEMLVGLARIKAALIRLDTASYDDLNAALADMTEPSSPWRANAHEILGIAAYKAGKFSDANTHAQAIIDDAQSSSGLRDRAHVLQAVVAPNLPPVEDTVKIIPAETPAASADTAAEPTPSEPTSDASSDAKAE
ncbi:MAG: tetratricopeptide repeat protein [Rhizobiales bacterium]|nr:tetratricopeptide repeat protein [Hyphomicrobiales bacterium]